MHNILNALMKLPVNHSSRFDSIKFQSLVFCKAKKKIIFDENSKLIFVEGTRMNRRKRLIHLMFSSMLLLFPSWWKLDDKQKENKKFSSAKMFLFSHSILPYHYYYSSYSIFSPFSTHSIEDYGLYITFLGSWRFFLTNRWSKSLLGLIHRLRIHF